MGSDADGIGSELGLYYLLRSLKKEVWILNNEPVPLFLSFMDPDGLVHHIQEYENKQEELIEKLRGSFVFILDSSEPERSEKVAEAFLKVGCPFATIDHHLVEPKKNYCADPSYAATAEIIWDLYHFYSIKIPPKAALPLYVALVSDSGNFRYPKSSLRTHLAGGELLGYGLNSDEIFRAIYENQPADRLRFLQRVLKKAEINKEKGYVIAEIKPAMYRKLELGDTPNEGVVNLLLGVREIRLSAVITKTSDGLKCSLRSRGDVDVASLAKRFGGGGHKNAAGLKLVGSYREQSKKLKEAIRHYL